MRISACIIAKNEESNIVKCLNSMKPIVDEIIVVDTGSTDQTAAAARSCGAVVYSSEWQNDFAAAKNFAINKAKGDWIIFLDADEYVSEESIPQIKDCLLKIKKQAIDAIMCQLVNIDIDNDNRVKDTFSAIRIFRNAPEIGYINAIHEELVNKKNNKLRLAVLTDEIKIYHTGYSSSIVEGKLKRNLEIILADINKNGKEEKYYRYLCDCYHGLKKYDQAVKYAKLHIASNKTSLHSESIVYLKMLYAMTQTNASRETIQNEFESTIKIFPQIPDFYAQYANFLLDQKLYTMAITYYLKAIEVYKKNANTQMASAFNGKLSAIYCNLGRLFSLKNESESAMNYFCEALIADKWNSYAFQKFYMIISKYPEVQIIELLNSIYHRTKEDISFVVDNLSKTVLNKVYVYYTNVLQKDFGVENDLTIPYQLLSLKKYEKLYQYSLNNLYEVSSSINNRQTGFMEKKDKTSIVILTYNQLDYTKLCIESIRNYTEPGTYEIIVVDNHSTDETVNWLKNQADITCIFNERNNGFPKGCNQGIEIACGSEILLLNNDTIVTSNWLANLKTALYSGKNIGAVGPLTNNCSNYQAIKVDYKDTNELQVFAQKYNVSTAATWEEKIKLVGFCMLIKRSVVDEIGALDEVFTPGNFEDDDYSFRMIRAGYRLLLCHDTFIHHFGSISFKEKPQNYHELLNKNALKFKEKWGFDARYSTFCRNEIINLMDINKTNMKVLEVGCACGTTLLKIKHLNKTAEIYGIELCPEPAAIAKQFATVTAENIENVDLAYEEGFFDYIIFADVLEHLYDPLTVLQKIQKYLKADGYIVASVPNVMHYSVVKSLLAGSWTYEDAGILDRTHIRFFTLKEIDKMFRASGFSELTYGGVHHITNQNENPEEFIKKLKTLDLVQDEEQLKVYQYLVKAGKTQKSANETMIEKEIAQDKLDIQQLKFILRRIENDIDLKQNLNELVTAIKQKQYDYEQIIESIEKDIFKKSKVIAYLITAIYEKSNKTDTLNFAEAAYQVYSEDVAVVYAVASILYLLKEKEKALFVLENFPGKDKRVVELKAKICGGK
ncbi:MAG: methyltransferase protein [Firmicutes bacterium]|nr:methyltransferase protein [Bacillota bacterium]